MVKIGILNESFLNETHLERLGKLGDIEILIDTDSKEKAMERISEYDIIAADMFICPLDKEVLEKAKNLKLIALNTTAFEKVDLDYAKSKNIKVTNVPNFSTDSVAENSFNLILSLARKTVNCFDDYRKEKFEIFPDVPDHRKYLGINLKGKTLGVIGLGNIGSRVCEIGRAFGMNVIGYNRSQKNISGVESVSLDDLYSRSDVISINCPVNEDSETLFDADTFLKMKKNSILVNSSGEEIIDNNALLENLNNGKLFGVGIDNIRNEEVADKLMEHTNVVIVPMIGWFTEESLNNAAEIITSNIEEFLKGNEKNTVN